MIYLEKSLICHLFLDICRFQYGYQNNLGNNFRRVEIETTDIEVTYDYLYFNAQTESHRSKN